MRFSVVIPVYNVASYLTGCVSSVLNSTETDYEIILVDDGSTDGRSGPLCDTLAARCPNRIRVIHQKNLGGRLPQHRPGGSAGRYLFFRMGTTPFCLRLYPS